MSFMYFRNGEIKKDKLEISKLRFSVVDELFDNLDDNGILQEIAEKRQRLKNCVLALFYGRILDEHTSTHC